ncbi:MAG: hypothetical protein ABJE47_13650 [bacterium]
MSDSSTMDSLTQRLVANRLSSPGVLDRGSLQRAHEKFTKPSSAHELPRLQRRATPASASTESLPLVRVDRMAEAGAPPIASAAILARSAVAAGDTGAAVRSAPGVSTSDAGSPVARHAPVIARASDLVVRRAIATDQAPVVSRAPASSDTITPGNVFTPSGAAATGTIQRMAESHVTASTASSSAPQISFASELPIVRRSALGASGVPVPSRSGTSSDIPRTSPLPLASPVHITGTAMPVLSRKADAPAQSLAPSVRLGIPASPSVAASALLLRKPEQVASPSVSRAQAPSITTTSRDVVARTAEAPQPATSDAPWSYTDDRNIDWIAEQVGNRLARRLEIERERMGVRQWRQLS